jgi:hypothetical protein
MPHADTEFLYRVIAAGKRIVYVPQKLFYYRNHDAQVSKLGGSMHAALVAFHRKHFLSFGFMFDAQVQHADAPEKFEVQVCPPKERARYARKHFAPHDVAPRSAWAA